MAGRVLERGHSLVWFPESWRSPDGKLQRFLPGVGHLLCEHPVPVIPAYIKGTFEAMPRDRSWPRPFPVTVTFGAAVDSRALESRGTEIREKRALPMRCGRKSPA
jgi:long-chain acyl-CoA synthetase